MAQDPPEDIARFENALTIMTGPQSGPFKNLRGMPVLGSAIRAVHNLVNISHRFLVIRSFATVGYSNRRLLIAALNFLVYWIGVGLFFWNNTLLGIATGNMGPVFAIIVWMLGACLMVLVPLSTADMLATIKGTIAHAKGQKILEQTDLQEVEGLGHNIFSPRD